MLFIGSIRFVNMKEKKRKFFFQIHYLWWRYATGAIYVGHHNYRDKTIWWWWWCDKSVKWWWSLLISKVFFFYFILLNNNTFIIMSVKHSSFRFTPKYLDKYKIGEKNFFFSYNTKTFKKNVYVLVVISLPSNDIYENVIIIIIIIFIPVVQWTKKNQKVSPFFISLSLTSNWLMID